MLDTTLTDQTQALLDAFGEALGKGDVEAATAMFQDDCYWRDLVSFTWNIKTVEGKEQVADMLRHQLATTKPSGITGCGCACAAMGVTPMPLERAWS